MFTIGPVQSFIAQARKARDLYAGSFLLSWLIKSAVDFFHSEDIKKVFPEGKIEVMFPSIESESVPNRIVAVVTGLSDDRKLELGKKIEQHVRKQFRFVADKVIKSMGIKPPGEFYEQIESHLEVYWLFYDYDDYGNAYVKATMILSDIKKTRMFSAKPQAPGKKCSLNPEKNAIFSLDKQKYLYNAVILDKKKYKFDLKEFEALCAVSFVKRFLVEAGIKEFKRFSSVCEVILKSRLHKYPGLMEKAEKIIKKDADIIFDIWNNNPPDVEDEAFIEEVKQVVEDIKRETDLTSYYAVIKFDGDSMGKRYSVPELKPGCSMELYHIKLSQKLCEFAQAVDEKLIKKEEGFVIYAGGEDFLGIVSIDCLFEVLLRLRKEFGKIDLSEFYKHDKPLTFSAGISIAHYKSPLQYVLMVTDEMEHYAKSIDEGKDAFAIAVIKRSGEIIKTRAKFGKRSRLSEADCSILENVRDAFKQLYESEVPMSFMYKLKDTISRLNLDKLSDRSNNTADNMREMVKIEIKRLLKKSSYQNRNSKASKNTIVNNDKTEECVDIDKIEECAKILNKLYDNIPFDEDFINMLDVITFLAREMKM